MLRRSRLDECYQWPLHDGYGGDGDDDDEDLMNVINGLAFAGLGLKAEESSIGTRISIH